MSMPTEEQLVAAIEELFAEAYEGKRHDYTWFVDSDGLFQTIAKLSAEEASRAAADGGTTIAGHAEHLRWSLALANAYARGERPQANWAESWTVTRVDDAAWAKLQEDVKKEYGALHETLRPGLDLADPQFVRGVIGMIVHGAYHLGAIRQRLPRT